MNPKPSPALLGGLRPSESASNVPLSDAARANLWNDEARRLVARIEDYEENHPADSLCLAPALAAARCCAYGDGVEHTR